MKKVVKIESQSLQRDGYDAVDVDGKTYGLGAEVTVTEAEAKKVQEADLESAFGKSVTVSISDAAGDDSTDADEQAEDSSEPSPDPEPQKGRSR